jgi:hypothetical protein
MNGFGDRELVLLPMIRRCHGGAHGYGAVAVAARSR